MDQNMSYDDAPETPAPLFALKAFRHALFGTPKADDNLARPKQTRASTLPNRPARRSVDLGSSPTKGILLTPGTSASKRKTVTFRGQQEREERIRLGATPQAPGHFPDPDHGNAELKVKSCTDPSGTQSSHRTGTDADQQSSLQLRGKVAVPRKKTSSATVVDEDETTDMAAPRSISGKYWKSEFDAFSSKSATEMRKLTKKERLAKTFAKTKDSEALELRDQLKQEQRKIADLERRLAEYKTRLSQSIDVFQQPRLDADVIDKHSQVVTSQRTAKETVEQRSRMESAFSADEEPTGRRSLPKSNPATSGDSKRAAVQPEEPQPELKAASHREVKERNGSARGLPSSDIWADIGNTSEAAGDHAQALQGAEHEAGKEFSMKSPAKRPLRQRSVNLEGKAAEGAVHKTSNLPEDRRAAALKRLGERRQNRKLANSTNGR